MDKRIVLTFGTRPEAIKMAPVYLALTRQEGLEPLILLTGQHREQLYQALEIFNVPVTRNLDVMTHRQKLPDLAARILPSVAATFRDLKAHYVLVHGDTLTTFVSAWAAFLEGIPVGHVEAGLRSGTLNEPFPEEANRILTDNLSDLLFAPTQGARHNLLAAGFDEDRIVVTGQTAVDAVHFAARMGKFPPAVPPIGQLVTVTLHRRENWPIMSELSRVLANVASRFPQWHFAFPVHLNPLVRDAVFPILSGLDNVTLLEPLDYGSMAALMKNSRLLLTDSGGLQEEGAALGVPVAVVRNVTERPEGIEAGIVTLLGAEPTRMGRLLSALLDDEDRLALMASAPNPYGDGKASERIAQCLSHRLL